MQLPVNLLCDQRPPRLVEDIEFSFYMAAEKERQGWKHSGMGQDYSFGLDTFHSASAVAATLNHPNPVVVDIGAGRADVVSAIARNGQYKTAIALGALKPDPVPENVTYIDGAIENRKLYEDISEPASFIVSRWAYVHFSDPIGSLELALNCLRKGGVMLVSHFILNANFGIEEFKEVLQASGVELLETTPWQPKLDVSFVAKRKSDEAIRFPLRYERARFGHELVAA